MRRWFAVVSVVAIGAVGALSALPASAGFDLIEPNCVVDNLFNGVPAEEVGPAVPAPRLSPAFCTEVEVTKVVTGDPAPGTTFDVVVECEEPILNGGPIEFDTGAAVLPDLPEGLLGPFEETLTFGEEGGTQTLLVGGGSNCTVSEVAPPGCQLVNINPDEFEIDYLLFFNGTAQVQPVPGSVLAVTVTNDCPPLEDPPVVIVTPTFTG